MNVNFRNKVNQPLPDNTLKVTALLYFKEALVKEQYETCAELLQSARGYGANPNEIHAVIDEVFGKGKGRRRKEANQQSGGRRRF